MPFDTLQAAKRLEAAGVETRQAEAMVDTMRSVFDSEFATKADIRDLEGKVATLGATLDGKINAARNELLGKMNLLHWMFGALFVLNVAVVVRVYFP